MGVESGIRWNSLFIVVYSLRHWEKSLSCHLSLTRLGYLSVRLHYQYVLVIEILSNLLVFGWKPIDEIVTFGNLISRFFKLLVNS